MTPIVKQLWETGHFWNPSLPNALNVKQGDLASLKSADAVVKEAIASFQQSDANVSTLAQAYHGRALQPDGILGPATRSVLDFKRCPIPDYPPPPGARFHFDDPGLQHAVETQQAFAMGRGSWPSCDPTRQGVNSFRVGLDTTRCPTVVKNYLVKCLAAVVQAYAEIGCAVRYVLDGDPKDCEISKRFELLSGSVIGWNEFPDNDTCDQVIQGRLDTDYTPSDYRYWANLECHETGHGVGLQHGSGSIMNPSILLVWPLTWKGSYSFANLKRWFGGEPVPVSPGPGPGPGPTPKTTVSGVLTVERDGQTLGKFQVVPDPNFVVV